MMSLPTSVPEPGLLQSVTYPTNRHELLQRAKIFNSPDAFLMAIRRLPNTTFRSRNDLIAAVEEITTST